MSIYDGEVIYGVPLQINPKLNKGVFLFVIEMDNDNNKIYGISIVKNFIWFDKYYSIYTVNNLNRYVYKGTNFTSRDELWNENSEMVEIIELLCFKGKSHLKRIAGIAVLREKLLKDRRCNGIDLFETVKTVMNKIIKNKNNTITK